MRLSCAILITLGAAALACQVDARASGVRCYRDVNPITGAPLCHPPDGIPFGVGAGNHFDISAGTTGETPSYLGGGGGGATFNDHAADARFRLTTSAVPSNYVQVLFSNRPWPYGVGPSCFAQSHTDGTGPLYTDSTPQALTVWWDNLTPSVRMSVLCVGF